MWQCDNCGYTDEDGGSFEEETQEGVEDSVRYCPECGSDEVFEVDDDQDPDDLDDEDDDDLDDDWDDGDGDRDDSVDDDDDW